MIQTLSNKWKQNILSVQKFSDSALVLCNQRELVASSFAWHWHRTCWLNNRGRLSKVSIPSSPVFLEWSHVWWGRVLAVSGTLCENTRYWPLCKQGYVQEQHVSPSPGHDGWFSGDLYRPCHPWLTVFPVCHVSRIVQSVTAVDSIL